ncbi:MAG: hypothetical protein R3260_00345 [Pseudomonas sp.]|nr:hypothetical protein [Pseudomonas sp.]
MAVQPGRPVPARRRNPGQSSSEPADPHNSNRPLAHLGTMNEGKDEGMRAGFDRWAEDYEIEDGPKRAIFWDAQAIVAASLAFAFGTIAGIPLGHYLYSVWF